MKNADKDRAAFSWFTLAWDDYISFLPLLLAVALAQTAVSAGSFYIMHRTHSLLAAVPYMLLVITPVTTGANLVYIKAARGTGPRFRDLFSAFPVYHKALAVSVGLGLAAMGGVLLLVIPGIVIYLTFMFSEFAVVDRRTGIKESFALSSAITDGWKTRLLPILMLTLAVNLMVPDIFLITGPAKNPTASLDLKPWTIAAAVLKSLVFLPWLTMTMARAYNFMLAQTRPAPVHPPSVDA